ncbi:hypothetical protein ACOSQ4_027722 [Xanthoceras sorbifolium]
MNEAKPNTHDHSRSAYLHHELSFQLSTTTLSVPGSAVSPAMNHKGELDFKGRPDVDFVFEEFPLIFIDQTVDRMDS